MFTERGCPWRNGTVEQAVGLAKTTLPHQLDGNKSLNFAKIDELFLRVSYIVNYILLTILLLGRAAGYNHKQEEDITEANPDVLADTNRLLTSQERLCEKWWEQWSQISFPLFVPRKKWSQEHLNVRVGDIVLLHYDNKVSQAHYRIARVVLTHSDYCNVVQTVNQQEKVLPYKAKYK